MALAALALAVMVPAHTRTWLYYGLNGINTTVPAQVIASYADFAESDVYESDRSEAFKQAGGSAAVAYTDPTFVPYCLPPFKPPAGPCWEPVQKYQLPENAWIHSADGARIQRYADPHFHYQEALNPAAPATQRFYHEFTGELLRRAPKLDYFFADDAGGTLALQYYRFSAPGVELNDAALVAGRRALFAAAQRPVFINGHDPSTWLPAYGGALLTAPNVAGEVHEGCFDADDYGLLSDAADRWRKEADSLLFNTSRERYALCLIQGTMAPDHRLYAMASWWMTYDERWSIAGPVNKGPDGYAIFPEYDIVPRVPRESAGLAVGSLRRSGLYVREFAACYQRSHPIGPCAAVVNPSATPLALPAFAARYDQALHLDAEGVIRGGRARWEAGVPARIDGERAVILRKAA